MKEMFLPEGKQDRGIFLWPVGVQKVGILVWWDEQTLVWDAFTHQLLYYSCDDG